METILLNHTRKALAVAVLASITATPTMAQLVLEEVVVTANKRESNLMDTAAAVSAFDADNRSALGIDNFEDIALRTPSLTVAPSRVSIRGVGRSNIALGSDPGVGIYWDGVYTTENDVFSASNFLDVDRVEVLRGPQGTLYGRNTIGGAVNILSVQPDDEEWGGKAVLEVGNYDYYVAQGLASGPVTDKLSALVALSHIEREGLQKNEGSGQRLDEDDRDYGSIILKHDTSDSWTNTLKVTRRESDYVRSQPYVLDPYSTDFIQFIPDASGAILNLPGMFPRQNFANGNQGMTRENPALRDEDRVSVDVTPSLKQDRTTATFTSEMDFESYTLKYIGGYSDFDYESDYDADGIKASDSGLDWSQIYLAPGIPVSLVNGGFTLTPGMTTRPFSQSNETYSHELQIITDPIADFSFIAGLYYYNSEEDQTLSFIESNDELMATYRALSVYVPGAGPSTVSDNNFLFDGVAELETTSYAAYGQMDWDWTDDTVVTVGIRYSYDEKKGTDQTFVQYVGDPGRRKADDDWDQVTWRLGVDHTISDDHFLYGFIATGYRSGGFNLMAPTDTLDVNSVDPEEITSFELGYKGTLLDDRLNLASALYYYDYSDLQVRKTDIVNGVTVPVFENASDATAWGFESEVMALLTENLILSGTYSYNNTEYDDYESVDTNACAVGPLASGNSLDPLCTETQDLSGNEFLLSPEHKASANLTYLWNLVEMDWHATVSYQYTGEQYTTAFNNEDYDKLDDWGRWDARLGVASPEGTWEVVAWVQNISDDREAVFNDRPSSISHLSETTLSDPRTYGLKLTYNF